MCVRGGGGGMILKLRLGRVYAGMLTYCIL